MAAMLLEATLPPLYSLDSCVQYLFGEPGNARVQIKINEILALFYSDLDSIPKDSLRLTVDAAHTVFARCLQVCVVDC